MGDACDYGILIPPGDERMTFYFSRINDYVRLSVKFKMMAHEATQKLFTEVMSYNPSRFSQRCGPDCPVEQVTWHEAAVFANELSVRAGLEECYDCIWCTAHVCVFCDPMYNPGCRPQEWPRLVWCFLKDEFFKPQQCKGYRHPTLAEWEFAARAGTTTATYNGDLDDTACSSSVVDTIAWYCGNGGGRTHLVATRDPNSWGLYDMLGNVWEWCHDWHDDYPEEPMVDPWGPATGSHRVIRGGSYFDDAWVTRTANRCHGDPGSAWHNHGIRPVRTLP